MGGFSRASVSSSILLIGKDTPRPYGAISSVYGTLFAFYRLIRFYYIIIKSKQQQQQQITLTSLATFLINTSTTYSMPQALTLHGARGVSRISSRAIKQKHLVKRQSECALGSGS